MLRHFSSTNFLLKLALSGIVICAPVLASTISTVSTAAGTNICNLSGTDTASCTSSTPGPNGPETASANATSTWLAPGGRLEATTYADGPGTTASASISFSAQLIVTGVTGSGDLDVQFSGFQDTTGGQQPGTVNPLTVMIDGSSQSVTLPNLPTSPFTVTAPVNFGVAIPFSVSISDSAAGSFFHNGTYIAADADGVLLEPSFVVTDANGSVLGNGTVEFVPEPGTLGPLGCAIALLLWFGFRRFRVPVSRTGRAA
jgi:hypothetical protein